MCERERENERERERERERVTLPSTLLLTDSDKSKEPSSAATSPLPVGGAEDVYYSKMARTHNFKRLRTPARCRGCDTYVYFHGFECETVSV